MQVIDKYKSAAVGVVVGRFQVHELHEGHIDLLDTVCGRHHKVIVVLGVAPVITSNNPLDFEARKQMILTKYPNVTVTHLRDTRCDKEWSTKLDQIVRELTVPMQTVVLYGARDSFVKHYSGRLPTQELESERIISMSGTAVRERVRAAAINDPSFRAGVVFGSLNQWPKVVPTVDIAIFNEDYSKILLARKSGETEYRFVGGYADPRNESYEDDAKREAMEETGLEVGDITYIGSRVIHDWRYASCPDKIRTSLFAAKLIYGAAAANDDIEEVAWFAIDPASRALPSITRFVPEHRDLRDMLQGWLCRRALPTMAVHPPFAIDPLKEVQWAQSPDPNVVPITPTIEMGAEVKS